VGVCAGIKQNGGRCTVSVEAGQTYCHHHDPARADERRRAASRAGRSKPSREIRGLKKELEDLAKGVLDGSVERGNAVVVNQILNTRVRLIDLERRVKETEDLEERIGQLERTQEQKGGRWGA
jgi:hypothetical protein